MERNIKRNFMIKKLKFMLTQNAFFLNSHPDVIKFDIFAFEILMRGESETSSRIIRACSVLIMCSLGFQHFNGILILLSQNCVNVLLTSNFRNHSLSHLGNWKLLNFKLFFPEKDLFDLRISPYNGDKCSQVNKCKRSRFPIFSGKETSQVKFSMQICYNYVDQRRKF